MTQQKRKSSPTAFYVDVLKSCYILRVQKKEDSIHFKTPDLKDKYVCMGSEAKHDNVSMQSTLGKHRQMNDGVYSLPGCRDGAKELVRQALLGLVVFLFFFYAHDREPGKRVQGSPQRHQEPNNIPGEISYPQQPQTTGCNCPLGG